MAQSVLIENILEHCNPVTDPPWWGCENLTAQMVEQCIADNRLRSLPAKNGVDPAIEHAARIAYLYIHPDATPIHIDVGISEDDGFAFGVPGRWLVEDGNHRLFAAVMRDDLTVDAEISGSFTNAKSLLDVDLDDDEDTEVFDDETAEDELVGMRF
jgi:hypothetical protein